MQNHTKGIIYASITAFFWGFLAIALKIAVREIEPVTVVWFRFLIAFVLLSIWQITKNPSAFFNRSQTTVAAYFSCARPYLELHGLHAWDTLYHTQ